MMWLILVLAGIFEMLGITFMNFYTNTSKKIHLLQLLIYFGISFILLSIAFTQIPMSTGYAIWTGIGAVGGAIVGMLFFNESKNIKRIICIALILGSTIGLKLVS
ncbi:multidrug efflux SMR transporter [Clostridioides difficile]|uniref:DMT family transporter n=1 Tax=Clostridioides difficile TaxID=1496 RepID=UPI001430DD7F|nr:multidrug efflux SMR transporter [Clostridioides difficile]NJI71286.1 multidrug efflux SMR transporter [Clostridioides difficile]